MIYLHELIYETISDWIAQNRIMLYLRYIDDIFIVWRGHDGTLANSFCEMLNSRWRHVNFEITWEISEHTAIFLDVRLWFGSSFDATGLLNTGVFQKAMNRYLYLPFYSCHARHTLRGFIKGEFKRYLIRSSIATDYFDILCDFYGRLHRRGYPRSFLNPLFAAAPRFEERMNLILKIGDPKATQAIPFVLKFTFSPVTERLGLQAALEDDYGELPAHLRSKRRLVVFKRAPRLGDLLSKNNNSNRSDPNTPPQLGGGVGDL